MIAFLPRTLYMVTAVALFMLVWPNPVTLFLAACFSCLTIPVYQKLKNQADRWQKKLALHPKPTKINQMLQRMAKNYPICAYALFIIFSFLAPFAVIALLVSPQAVAGMARLRELKASNFQLPPHWVQYLQELRRSLHEYPTIEKALNDTINNLDSMITDAVGMLVSRSFGFVGSTMNVV